VGACSLGPLLACEVDNHLVETRLSFRMTAASTKLEQMQKNLPQGPQLRNGFPPPHVPAHMEATTPCTP
jgi:hypothetical protein